MTVAVLCSRFGPPKVGHARIAGGCRRGACSRRGYFREGAVRPVTVVVL
jgi:hypothetical protein